MGEKELLDIFDKLNIKYNMVEHEAVYTVEEASKVDINVDGLGCKNLFLTGKKGTYYLAILEDNKRADLNGLRKFIHTKRLSFASEEELFDTMKLKRGSCTPFGIINDKDNKVVIVIDKDLVDKKLQFHPNRNTATVSIEYFDLIKFLEYNKHRYVLWG